jgi:uncharacterized protein YlxP (DUF503 family)
MNELKEIREKLTGIELNFANYNDDDVRELQGNMFEAVDMIDRLEAEAKQPNEITTGLDLDHIRELYRNFIANWQDIMGPNSDDCFINGFIAGESSHIVLTPKEQREGAPEGPLPKLMEFVYEPADMAAIREIQEAIWIIDKFPGSIELTQALDLLKAAKVNIASICADERKKAADRYCAFCESHGDCRSYVRCSDRLAILGER